MKDITIIKIIIIVVVVAIIVDEVVGNEVIHIYFVLDLVIDYSEFIL